VKLDTNKGGWWFVLLLGLLLTASGLFGVWLQGWFYRGGFPTAATVGEVRGAFTWPAANTAAGSLFIAAVILASPLTASWTASRRLAVFVVFTVLVLAACFTCGYFAAGRVAKMLN
jgi:hypothetical protein